MIMDESLREIKLLGILDVLLSSEEPLTIPQIQYRLGVRGVDMARDVIEAHLSWGLNQPNATNAPIRVTRALHSDKWYYACKHPPTAEEIKAAGPLPFETPKHPPIKHIVWFKDGSNLDRYGTVRELAERYSNAIKIEEA